ncbi:MAG: hypothetical protein J6K98_00235 [Clostridia bacterium]|nr:hypothetical protein [Clostridia bacterium]
MNKATRLLSFSTTKRMAADSLFSRKYFLVSILEKDPSTSIMCITGVGGDSVNIGDGPVLTFTAVFLFAFEQCFADYASPSTPS